jgi:hypothetical protein
VGHLLTPQQVNRKGDEIAQVATDYTPAEIAFFKAVACSSSEIITAFTADTLLV